MAQNANDVRMGRLKAGLFFEPFKQRIFDQSERGARLGYAVTPVALKTTMEGDGALFEAGNEFLAMLGAASCDPITATSHAKMITDLFFRREIARIAMESMDSIADFSVPAQTLMTEIESQYMSVEEVATGNTFVTAHEASKIALQNMFAEKGTLTGLTDLDRSVRGLKPGHVYILAGRPGMGKTALAIQIAINIAKQGMISQFHTMEMGADEIMGRAVSHHIDMPYVEYLGVNNERAINRIGKIRGFDTLPLLIDDRAGLTTAQVATAVRRAKRIHSDKPFGALTIDYLGLMKDTGRYQSKVHSLGEICKDLKNLARKEEIPVVLLAQLSRGVEARDNKRPIMSDLRDSGEIEQDASVIMFVYRHAYYLQQEIDALEFDPEKRSAKIAEMARVQNEVEIIIGKNRNGPCNNVRLYCEIEKNYFTGSSRAIG